MLANTKRKNLIARIFRGSMQENLVKNDNGKFDNSSIKNTANLNNEMSDNYYRTLTEFNTIEAPMKNKMRGSRFFTSPHKFKLQEPEIPTLNLNFLNHSQKKIEFSSVNKVENEKPTRVEMINSTIRNISVISQYTPLTKQERNYANGTASQSIERSIEVPSQINNMKKNSTKRLSTEINSRDLFTTTCNTFYSVNERKLKNKSRASTLYASCDQAALSTLQLQNTINKNLHDFSKSVNSYIQLNHKKIFEDKQLILNAVSNTKPVESIFLSQDKKSDKQYKNLVSDKKNASEFLSALNDEAAYKIKNILVKRFGLVTKAKMLIDEKKPEIEISPIINCKHGAITNLINKISDKKFKLMQKLKDLKQSSLK